jgi:hypothetical protein
VKSKEGAYRGVTLILLSCGWDPSMLPNWHYQTCGQCGGQKFDFDDNPVLGYDLDLLSACMGSWQQVGRTWPYGFGTMNYNKGPYFKLPQADAYFDATSLISPATSQSCFLVCPFCCITQHITCPSFLQSGSSGHWRMGSIPGYLRSVDYCHQSESLSWALGAELFWLARSNSMSIST